MPAVGWLSSGIDKTYSFQLRYFFLGFGLLFGFGFFFGIGIVIPFISAFLLSYLVFLGGSIGTETCPPLRRDID